MHFCLFLIFYLSSCGPRVDNLDGTWSGKTVRVIISSKEKTFQFENEPDQTKSFSEKIISVEKQIGDKIEIQTTNDRRITLKTFGGDTMFIYLEDGYLRLKKDTD